MGKNFNEFSVGKKVLWIVGGIIFGAAMALLFGLIVKILWNWLMTDLFNLPSITYWQAWGIAFLSHILFKGGWPGNGGHGKSKKRDSHCGSWDDDTDEKEWEDEFRSCGEEFKAEFRKEFRKEFEKEFAKETKKENGEKI